MMSANRGLEEGLFLMSRLSVHYGGPNGASTRGPVTPSQTTGLPAPQTTPPSQMAALAIFSRRERRPLNTSLNLKCCR